MKRALVLSMWAVTAAACFLPARDNENDPAVRPSADVEVLADGASTTISVGGFRSTWVLDGGGSFDPDGRIVSWEWSISNAALGDPAAAPESDWTVLPVSAPAVLSTNADFAAAIASLASSLAGGEANVPGTGFAVRAIRLRVTDDDGNRSEPAFGQLAIANRAPRVSLGPDRRVAPGGRWWATTTSAHLVTIAAVATDPDASDGAFLDATPGTWRAYGAIASLVDSNGDEVVDARFEVAPGKIRVPATIEPSRSRITYEVTDGVATRVEDVALDVLSSHWSYGAATGHFERLDTSRLLSPGDGIPKQVLGVDGAALLVASFDGANVVLARYDSGFHPLDSSSIDFFPGTIAKLSFFTAASDGGGGWWILNDDDGWLRHYRYFNNTWIYDAELTGPEFQTANYGRLANAIGSRDVWITAGNGTTYGGKRLKRITTAGAVIVDVPALDTSDASGTIAQSIAPAADGSVWVAGGVRVSRVTSATVRKDYVAPGCIESGVIGSMAFDPKRESLWLAVEGGAQGRLCVADASNPDDLAWAPSQPVGATGVLGLDPLTGDAFMPANGGKGFSRYRARDGVSLDYIPIPQGYELAYESPVAVAQGGSLVAMLREQATYDTDRIFWAEAAEVHEPHTVIPGIDPYQFLEVDFAVDSHTGFLWMWRPDEGTIEAWSPRGERLRTIDTGLSPSDAEAFRGAIAIDADARKLWFAWAPRYTGNIPVMRGRLLSFEIPDVTLSESDEIALGEVDDVVAPVTLTTAGGIALGILWDLDVIPSTAPTNAGDVCVAGTTDPNQYLSGPGGVYAPALGQVGPLLATAASTSPKALATMADPQDGHCLFVPSLNAVTGFSYGTATRSGATVLSSDYARTLGKPSYLPDRAYAHGGHALVPAAGDFEPRVMSLYTTAGPPVPVLEVFDTPALDQDDWAMSLVVDPYYGHVLVGFGGIYPGDSSPGSGDGEIVRLHIRQEVSDYVVREMDRHLGSHWPRLGAAR